MAIKSPKPVAQSATEGTARSRRAAPAPRGHNRPDNGVFTSDVAVAARQILSGAVTAHDAAKEALGAAKVTTQMAILFLLLLPKALGFAVPVSVKGSKKTALRLDRADADAWTPKEAAAFWDELMLLWNVQKANRGSFKSMFLQVLPVALDLAARKVTADLVPVKDQQGHLIGQKIQLRCTVSAPKAVKDLVDLKTFGAVKTALEKMGKTNVAAAKAKATSRSRTVTPPAAPPVPVTVSAQIKAVLKWAQAGEAPAGADLDNLRDLFKVLKDHLAD